MSRIRWFRALIAAWVVLGTLGCGLSTLSTSPVATITPFSAAPTSSSPLPTPPVSAASAPSASVAPNLDVLLEARSYESLTSFRAVDEAGVTLSELSVTTRVDRGTHSVEHILTEAGAPGASLAGMTSITIGLDTWLSFGDQWMRTATDATVADPAVQMAQSFSHLGTLTLLESGVDEAGVPADYYSYAQPVGTSMVVDAALESGEVWLAQESDLLLRLSESGTGLLEDDAGSTPVRYKLTWEVISLNAPVAINPPDLADAIIPVMDGALTDSSFVASSTMAAFEIRATAQEVVNWYGEALAAQGWAVDLAQVSSTEAMVSYTKGQEAITLVVSPSQVKGQARVTVILSGG